MLVTYQAPFAKIAKSDQKEDNSHDGVDKLHKFGITKPYVLYVDGGASANDFLMQFQSDMLGCDIVRPVVRETTARGAAFLAGLATGFWDSKVMLNKLVETDRVFAPKDTKESRESKLDGWRRAIAGSKGNLR